MLLPKEDKYRFRCATDSYQNKGQKGYLIKHLTHNLEATRGGVAGGSVSFLVVFFRPLVFFEGTSRTVNSRIIRGILRGTPL